MKSNRFVHSTVVALLSSSAAFAGKVSIDIEGPHIVNEIPSDTFTVCAVAGQNSHPGFRARHLMKDDFVAVDRNETFGRVVLAQGDAYRQTELTLIGDKTALLGTKSLPHVNESNGEVQGRQHLVVLTYIAAEKVEDALGAVPPGCDEDKGLLEITFCFEKKASLAAKPKWLCIPEEGDFGHVHAQN